MEILQAICLLMIAVLGTVVVVTREPLSQVVVLSLFGTLFALLFTVYQAPAAALSQLVVSAAILPLIVVITIARTRRGKK